MSDISADYSISNKFISNNNLSENETKKELYLVFGGTNQHGCPHNAG
jgi:hypothetical protein